MCGFLYDVGEAIPDGVDAAGRAVSRGLDAVNNACNKANDSMEAIIETVVSSPNILADMIADSMVGQYWSDFWDLNVDSVNAIEGILEDTAEELANDEDVPGFIRDYMNGFICADVPCNFFGMLGAGCRGAEEMLSGVYKGTSGVLGHPCQTEENIADALIIAGDATKDFIEDPQKATENAISSVSGWWNDKNTYEKIRTVVEAYIMYRMIASSGSKGKTATLESEAAGVTEKAGEAGEVAEEAAKAGEAAKAVEEGAVGGKGKVKIESSSDSNKLIPQGFTKKEFDKFIEDVIRFSQNNDLPDGKLMIHGSRAKGTATSTSDIDIILRVDKNTFDAFAAQRLSTIPEGTRLYKTIMKAVKKQKLSVFDISKDFGKNLHNDLIPLSPIKSIDFSIIVEDSPFDKGPFIDIN